MYWILLSNIESIIDMYKYILLIQTTIYYTQCSFSVSSSYRSHNMKFTQLVSHPAFIFSSNAGNTLKSIMYVVLTVTGVTIPTEVQSEITKLSKEFTSQVKQKKWDKQGFLKISWEGKADWWLLIEVYYTPRHTHYARYFLN